MGAADCIFCKMVAGQIPAAKIYEDEIVLAAQPLHECLAAGPISGLLPWAVGALDEATSAHYALLSS